MDVSRPMLPVAVAAVQQHQGWAFTQSMPRDLAALMGRAVFAHNRWLGDCAKFGRQGL